MEQPIDIAIVGAGAAGLATAIFARRANPQRSVIVLDGAKRPGAKILVSGGSRCNVTNRVVTETDFWGGRRTIVRRVLRAFSPDSTIALFSELGVSLHEEAEGKLFPDSNRSRDVLDALLRGVVSAGAELRADHRVVSIERDADTFALATSRGPIRARRVVLATGGQSLPKSGSDGAGYAMARHLGHTIVPTTPALVPLVVGTDPPVGANTQAGPSVGGGAGAQARESVVPFPSGVSHDAALSVWLDGRLAVRLRGALLWTHFGISGPVALNASRHWLRGQLEGRDARITVSFLPDETFETLGNRLLTTAAARPKLSVGAAATALLPASVAATIIARTDIDPSLQLAQFPRGDRRRLVAALIEMPLPIAGSRGYNFAEATAGGVALDEINPATLESRVCPGLYVVGEILDVDGRIGGFNFQWAWSSAFVAGRALGAGSD